MKKTACFLALLLALVTINLTPITALAAGEIYVGGTDVSGGGYYVNDGNGGITATNASSTNYNVHYATASSTLYLNGARITKTYSVNDTAACIYSDIGAITISGTDSVVTNTNTDKDFVCGVYAFGNLTVNGTLTATAGAASGMSAGISANSSIVISSGSDVTATGGAADDGSCGVYAGTGISASGGTLTATGGGNASSSYGLYTNNTINISGSANVAAIGSAAGYMSIGACANHIDVSGGTLTATGGTASGTNGESYGIFANTNISLTGGHITAQCGAAIVKQYAFNRQPTFTDATQTNAQWYKWRLSDSGTFTESRDTAYTRENAHTYVEITPSDIQPTPQPSTPPTP